MKREMIMSVEARNQRQSIIAFNRRKRIKRHINSQYNKDCIKSETKSTQRHEVMSTTDTISSTDTNVHIMSNDSDYCGYDFTELSLIPTGDVNEMLYEKAFILGMNVMSIARPITDRNIFNELEGNRFRELLIAMNITDNQLLGNINTLPVETYNDFVKIADIQREIDIKYLARSWTTPLMTAIVLFNPYRPGLKYKAIVKLQQHIYMHLLKRYLMMKYGTESEANEKFMHLYYLDMKCKQSLLQRPYHPLPPLLREIIQT
ncbi:unnamed protein product [Medioppia subpectinata]|uniref:NR LBD domain-containing protein n=1 Tax=Medioppia subpectinata TaxID=1979941 RepID=A0A7R9PV71_9ACAR|nr:unnamed protein product [Medioppia subpectinata]CAG2101555.1 unnamed protein product [Medioppia subpectinata]